MIEALQTVLIYGGSFIVVLGLVVFVHEFGHFQAGRWCGIAVKSFSFGMGPEWFGWTDKKGTRWKVSRFPVGGFVSWVDDADPTSTRAAKGAGAPLMLQDARRRGHYHAMPIWAKSITTAAGPLANFLFAIAAFAALILIMGRDSASISEVSPSSPAAAAGLRAGDTIRAIEGRKVDTFGELQAQIAASPGRRLALTVERGGERLAMAVSVGAQTVGEGAQARTVGVLGIGHTARPFGERVGPVDALGFGVKQTWFIIASTGTYIGDIFAGRQKPDQLAGPLGILHVTGQVASNALAAQEATVLQKTLQLVLSLVQLAAVLSVAVGIANLLPIPVLDGGNLVLYAIEFVRGGKRLPDAAQQWVLHAGFAAVAALFLFATWNDIQRFLG